MTTYTYALPRTENVWLLFSATSLHNMQKREARHD